VGSFLFTDRKEPVVEKASNWFVWMVLCAALTACATNPDPRKGGVVDGIAGIYGGGYDNRVKERQSNLNNLQSVNASIEERNKNLRQELAVAKTEERELQAKLTQVRGELNGLTERLNKMKARNQADKVRQAELRNKLASLNDKVDKVAQQGSSMREAELDKEINNLNLEKEKVEQQIKRLEQGA
jgi:chromosome segregation ATPase